MAGLGLSLFKGSSMPDEGETAVEETAEPLESPDSEAGDMATQGVMSALEDKNPVAFKDALATLLESMGYSKV